ncbi:MAG: bifunctional nuclease family protein [Prevotella sp.]|jgi:hypothetical protein|nr:bifunctional nuclease family protein [Prevotella sp.]
MDKVRLFYKDISEIVGGGGCAVIRMTDEAEQRALCVICDKPLSDQMSIRINKTPQRRKMLPEALLSVLTDRFTELEINIFGIVGGEYLVTLVDNASCKAESIRMSDALLLQYIAKVPIYIDRELMEAQSSVYNPDSAALSIPINTLETERLEKELERAVEEENYRLASKLHEELQKRQKS